MQPLEAGEPAVVGPYRLLGRLGSGGMGRVYLGRSAGGRTVAVKVVHPHFALDEEFRARFRREVDAARRVGGAWTAPVLDADPEASVPWVATGYAAGPSLTSAVTDSGPLPLPAVRALGAGLAEALVAVHALGLVHRDVKPSNVLLTLDGPVLIDFGIARAIDGTASITSTGVSIGSPGYMSPEQILGKGVAGAADVFSLGAVLAYAATGRPPFPGDSSAALLYKVVHEEPELDGLDDELREPVALCLAKDPAKRPAPVELARRLAPQGAARLVSEGWLPGPLVEQVSRKAVQLLNLEAETAPSGPARSGGAPTVEPSAAGARVDVAPAGAEAAVPVGVFGPPPVMTASGAPSTHVPRPREQQEPQDAVPSDADGPGRLSVSLATTSVPGTGGRGRRMSCTIALAVAGALAAVTVGSAFLLGMFDKDDSADDTAAGGAPTHGSATPGTGGSGVPAAYLGTWEGDATALGGTLPAGTFRVTVKQAGVGEEIGLFRSTDQLGGICDDVLLLKRVTDRQLVATSVAKESSNPPTCTTGRHEVRLTPAGADLEYETDNPDAGNPTSRLAKVG
ncbi:protein kinase [Streptomyces sp. NPDC058891]|uniref:serine/threonine-protein kinase n=1 Tax=Streptomyces sp. NPDC058891 TaxID=3346667 RepID=UPI003690297A